MYGKGRVTEVPLDFVVTPPQAAIGLQRSVLPSVGAHCCTALFTFSLWRGLLRHNPFFDWY